MVDGKGAQSILGAKISTDFKILKALIERLPWAEDFEQSSSPSPSLSRSARKLQKRINDLCIEFRRLNCQVSRAIKILA
jgi:hypothetical protein